MKGVPTMPDIVMRFDTEAEPQKVREALTTSEGIQSFWTSQATVPEEVGETLMLSFSMAPMPFDLRLEQADEERVAWRPLTFPPHWVGTEITWDLAANPEGAGTRVFMRHGGWRAENEDQLAFATFVWGLVLARLKEYVEAGRAEPALG